MPKKKQDPVLEEIIVPVKLKCTINPNRANNFLHLTIGDVGGEFKNGKKGELIGEVVGCMGGGMEVRVGKWTWTMGVRDLFMAVYESQQRKSIQEQSDKHPEKLSQNSKK